MGNVSLINGHIDEPMTDNEIFFASHNYRKIAGEDINGVIVITSKDMIAIDKLILHQKADLENYKQIAENQQSVSMDKEVEIKRLRAEVDRLKYNLEAVLQERADHSEAVKEFAERLKKEANHNWVIPAENVYDVLKEMVGEDK